MCGVCVVCGVHGYDGHVFVMCVCVCVHVIELSFYLRSKNLGPTLDA